MDKYIIIISVSHEDYIYIDIELFEVQPCGDYRVVGMSGKWKAKWRVSDSLYS